MTAVWGDRITAWSTSERYAAEQEFMVDFGRQFAEVL